MLRSLNRESNGLRLELLEARRLLATYTVTNDLDSGVGSFREAITSANASAGSDTIEFNITGVSPYSIQPTSSLPNITDPVVIDGTTQPGFSGSPIIELRGDGFAPGTGPSGLVISAGNSTVRGLVINRFDGNGIVLQTNGGNVLEGNYVGIDPAGNLWIANNWDRPDEGFEKVPDEALSTRFGGNGAVVFFGMAKPVCTPLIGPVQAQ